MIITAVSKKDAWQTSNDKHSKYFDILKKACNYLEQRTSVEELVSDFITVT